MGVLGAGLPGASSSQGLERVRTHQETLDPGHLRKYLHEAVCLRTNQLEEVDT